ncbi:right-handed parallel beta-helix repeat-containing protein [Planctomicrobium sp.]|nr:right-handed parallel beta-helix repeat-containing protein [Planctomicrobium sp.]MDB4733184.1 right-handed parallel beta-helix repeat-containing protein [Planctomicrobium sp.]MDB4743557.1 right-handed parallel beta-helix repeat-containing protein [Planctomicrobium sp.]
MFNQQSGIAVISFLCLANYTVAATIEVPKDHSKIQAAIDAAQDGDVILVAAGTYHERIDLKSGITVKSAGDDAPGKLGLKRAEATIIDGGGEGSKAGVTMAERSTLDGLTITNIGVYDDEKWNHHHKSHGNEQSHAHIGEPGVAGVSIEGVNCTVTNNIVHHIGYTGIAIQRVGEKPCSPHIYKNVCYRNMGGGIGSMKGSTAVIEENICFHNFYAGIGHDNASPTVISNTCYENIRAGIGVSEGSCAIVRGNRCYHNRRAGIGIRTDNTTRPLIEGNDCYENDMAGIGTDEGAAPTLRGNRCYRNKLAGIGVREHSHATIINNECYENGKAGIGQESNSVTILIGNYSHHNKASGIGFAACDSGESTLINNRVIDNALVAIGILKGWNVTLTDNELSREGGLPPIVMLAEGAEATFSNNVIRGSGVAGIRVGGKLRAESNQFVGTSLRKVGPPNFAVWGLKGANISLENNHMDTWRHALHATEADVTAVGNKITNFHRSAIVIQNSRNPANAYGNVAVSANSKDNVVTIEGLQGVVNNNILRNEEPDNRLLPQ